MANELTIDLTSGACVLGLTLAAASSQVRRHNGVRSWRDEEWFGVVLGLWIVHNQRGRLSRRWSRPSVAREPAIT